MSTTRVCPARKINVLHCTSSRGLYGAETVILNLCLGADRERFNVYLANIVDGRNPNREILDALAERGGTGGLEIGCRKRFDPRTATQLREVVDRLGIDVVHCHEHKSRFYSLLGLRWKRPVALVGTNHAWHMPNFIESLYERFDGFNLRFFDKVAAVSESLDRWMARLLIPASRRVVIPNGVDLDKVRPNADPADVRRSLGLAPEHKVIGCVARLDPEKGHQYLLQAARTVVDRFPMVRFLIIGGGPCEAELREKARELGLGEAVIFTGFRKDVVNLLGALDVFVLSSLSEGTPMALLEAMAVGAPAVATDVGGVGDVIADGRTGLLTPAREPGLTAEALCRFLSDPTLSARCAAQARELVERKYSLQSMVDAYQDIYAELARQDAPGAEATLGEAMAQARSRGGAA